MTAPTFFWHDYETFGADPRRDRAAQFAGIRTDDALEPVGEPVTAYCRLPDDVLPHPDAVLLTGITPQYGAAHGVAEPEFAAIVSDALGAPGTCGAGWNSIRFDDEFTRNILYRNFHDPYAREWEHGNCRWDLIDVARLCYALRPGGIEWPSREDGTPSFRLGDLASANGLAHERAHDALSDVEATLGLARRLRGAQRKLYDWSLTLRNKRRVLALLDVVQRTPVLHASSRIAASRGCVAIVMPLALLPDQANAVVVYDLDADPTDLLALDADAIRERVFVPRGDLPEGVERIPLKVVRANRCPALAPLSTLAGVNLGRIALDPDRAQVHAERLRRDSDIAAKVMRVFAREPNETPTEDPELAIYAGAFLSDGDRALLPKVRGASPVELAQGFPFCDPRYTELLFRYRARNHPETLDADERERWQRFRSRRLTREDGLAGITLAQYRDVIATRRATATATEQALLDALEAWGNDMAASLDA
ncbi:MAG TPA: exodeoxyribonuclease I [Candidatus Saccharimonadia bacterium]|nr:exodeoxyribonuclease I [Candidatus Saccharimonadia bacterium]